jgi:hypothetical protein
VPAARRTVAIVGGHDSYSNGKPSGEHKAVKKGRAVSQVSARDGASTNG